MQLPRRLWILLWGFLNSPFAAPVVAVLLGLIGSVFALIQDLPTSAIVGIGGGWLAGAWALFGLKERLQAMRTKSLPEVWLNHRGVDWRLDWDTSSRANEIRAERLPFCPKDRVRLVFYYGAGSPEGQVRGVVGGKGGFFRCPHCKAEYMRGGESTSATELALEADHLVEAEAAKLGL